MRISLTLVTVGLGLCLGLPAAAQHIGVLQSAETNEPGTWKILGAPIIAFGKNGADDEFGIAGRLGYGFTDRFDAELKVGFFESGTFVGADGEFWILGQRETGMDFSATAGVHWFLGSDENFDTIGFELTPTLSGNVSNNLELVGSLDASFESISDAPPGVDDSFTVLHLVPGIEYRLSDSTDLVAEIGVGLNDDSYSYAGIGLAFYLR